ncbi:MAG: flagellar hook protein FlgE [Betaproteobacteria bacterium HGW-Betaproteobacteria-8]|nr:MAG: flagellar hook protein FlgE [Betaproteobacteria bacterium HGW-Betaproteobacteria-8]
MSFQQGLSGLNAASKSLEVLGNNVANASTVGFKQSQTQFADVYANSLTGSGASQVGIGVKIAKVQQQFTQGNISATNNPLDIAINGGGFFRVSDNGSITYSRNGQFQMDKDGFIVNADNKRLTGFAADAAGNLLTGSPVELQIDTADLQPAVTDQVTGLINLDSREAALTAAGFDPDDPATYHNSTSVSIFDSLGNPHTLQSFFVKTAPGVWDVFTTVDGVTPATALTTMTFDGTGVAPTGSTAALSVPVTTGATTPFAVNLDFSGSTQFGSNFSVNSLSQNGFTSGRLSGFNVGADGIIVGRYTNGQSANLGQVVLANFVNPNGLQSLGNNAWAESSTSGAPLVSAPATGGLGVLQSSAVEDSNVDLTAELVNMITAQRVYQANAQTIKTQDQVLQTLVNLR